jgi:hypothetical protein
MSGARPTTLTLTVTSDGRSASVPTETAPSSRPHAPSGCTTVAAARQSRIPAASNMPISLLPRMTC